MPKSEAGRVLLGAMYTVGGRFFNRIVGLASTLVLARILTPDDYGVVAIGVLVLNFCQNLTDTGRGQYIIRSEHVTDDLVNTAWTLSLVVNTAVALCLIALSWPIADFFRLEEAQPVIALMSTMLIIGAFSNPGQALLQREQRYERIFRAGIVVKSITAVAVVVAAYVTRSYWALVLGQLLSTTLGCLSSYWMHPHRPRLCWRNVKEQWRFSRWLLGGSVFGFARSQFDTTLVGRGYEAAEVGAYHNMKYLSTLAATQIVLPALSPLLATISRSRNSPEDFRHQIEVVFLTLACTVGPLSILLYLMAPELVYILLGDQWTGFSGLFGTLALLSFPLCYMRVNGLILTSHGKTSWSFNYNIVSLAILAPVLISMLDQPVELLAKTRLIVDGMVSALMFLLVNHVWASITPLRVLHLLLLPVSAAAVGTAVIFPLLALRGEMSAILLFVACCALFIVSYTLTLWLLQHLAFRSDKPVRHLRFLVESFSRRITDAALKRWAHR